jgi:hypothetical protein
MAKKTISADSIWDATEKVYSKLLENQELEISTICIRHLSGNFLGTSLLKVKDKENLFLVLVAEIQERRFEWGELFELKIKTLSDQVFTLNFKGYVEVSLNGGAIIFDAILPAEVPEKPYKIFLFISFNLISNSIITIFV